MQTRSTIRRARKHLTQHLQRSYSKQICQRIQRLPLFRHSKHIAFYLPTQGEADPTPLLTTAQQLHKHCYLPVLHPLAQKRLWFVEYRPGDLLQYNQFRIAEPAVKGHKIIKPWALDLVITPVVAFDKHGHRLGTGMGYYDRSFAFVLSTPALPRPKLIGLAYDFQQIDRLTPQHWDVPLDMVVTEKRLYQMT